MIQHRREVATDEQTVIGHAVPVRLQIPVDLVHDEVRVCRQMLEAELVERQRGLLDSLGDPVLHIGGLGAAATIKVITNMLALTHLVAAGEALMLAKRSDLDLATAFEAIRNSSGNSFVHETESQVILNGSYNINFTMDLAVKDLGFAMAFGQESGVPLDLAGQVFQTFIRARETYGGQAWSPEVVRLLEDALSTDLRAPGFPEEIT